MRFLLLPSSYPPVLGGLQTVAHTLARNLIQRGHDVQVVTNRYPRSLPARQVLNGVPVYRWLFLMPDLDHLRERRPDMFLASLCFSPFTLFRLTRRMQNFRPEVVNVHFPDAQVPFVLWLRRWFDFRLVVSLHGHEIERWFLDEPLSIVHRPLSMLRRLRTILQEADGVTTCSRYLLNKAIQLEPSVAEKGRVIHNGIDPRRFKDKTSYPHPRPYILAYGRLTYKKGFDMLQSAFAQVARGHPGVDLIVAGDGQEREALQSQAHGLELDRRVHFFGRATPKEVVQLLNGCLFVVLPSREEPFGIVALEALAAGKPILATRVGGLPELLTEAGSPQTAVHSLPLVDSDRWSADHECEASNVESQTLLVEPSVAGLAKGLAKWLELAERSLLPASLSRALETYSWKQVVDLYEKVLRGASA
jgi:glycogen(starch) synthase